VCLAHRSAGDDHVQLRLVREHQDTAARLQSELLWLTHLAARHGLAVPQPRQWRTGNHVSPPLADHNGDVWRAAAFSWVAGRHLNAGLNQSAMRRAGALLAQLHCANRDAPAGIAESRPVWWIPRLFALATTLRDIVHEDAAPPDDVSASVAADLKRVHDMLVRAHAALPTGPTVSGLIHTDAHWQNLRFTQQRVGIVDFEDFATGRFMIDVACLWGKVEERRDSRALLDAVLAGYDSVAPLPASYRHDLHVMLAFRRFDYAGWVLSWPRRDLHAWGPSVLTGLAAYVERHLSQ
jgi:Ser/Thr protein kinase RdoA (MazF antagonist)